MEVLTSNWSNVQTMPQSFVFPPDRRPGDKTVTMCKDIPVIDLEKGHDGETRAQIIQQILEASEEFGLFQVINHGVSKDQMDETMGIFKEFFNMPAEYKAKFYSNDINKSCRLYASTLNYEKEEVHYWRDNFTHRCYPLEDHIQVWPEDPTNYREVVGTYAVEVRKLLLRMLDLIGEGLGLESGYFEGELSNIQILSVNHHVPCPDPSLTLGMPEHYDPNLISLLHQCDVFGLQALKNGEWVGVEPLTDAFLVIPGLQLRVISNERLTSPKHRVVTDLKEARTTIGSFLVPSSDFPIEPAKAIVGQRNPPIYRNYTYKEFFSAFTVEAEAALERFKL